MEVAAMRNNSCSHTFLGMILLICIVCAVMLTPQAGVLAATDLERGFEAALDEDWDEAVEHFGHAFERNPYNPIVQFNYGLAQARLGNDLIALALFNTYVSAVPDAANRPQVETQMDNLLSRAEVRRRRIVDAAIEAIQALPPGQLDQYASTDRRWTFLANVARSQIKSGHPDEARQTRELAVRILRSTSAGIEELEDWQITKALSDLENDLDDRYYTYELNGRALLQAEAWDFAGAEHVMDELIALERDVDELQGTLIFQHIEQLIDGGDLSAADDLLHNPEALYGTAPDMSSDSSLGYDREKLALRLLFSYQRIPDIEGMRRTASSFRSGTWLMFTQLQLGDFEGARRTAADMGWAARADCTRSVYAAMSGNRSEAVRLARNYQHNDFMPNSQLMCSADAARVYAYLGDENGAEAILDVIRAVEDEHDLDYVSSYARAYPVLAERRFRRAKRLIDRLEFEGDRAARRRDLVFIAAAAGEAELAEEYARDYGFRHPLRVTIYGSNAGQGTPNVMHAIAASYDRNGNTEAAARIRQDREEETAAYFAGWSPGSEEHVFAVNLRLTVAERMLEGSVFEGQDESLRDIDSFIDRVSDEENVSQMVYGLNNASEIHAREILRMRVLRAE